MAKDANFSNVSLLLHCDGANGSTAVIDSSQYAHTVGVSGTAAISTTKEKYGGASLYTGTVGATIPSSTAFDFGSGDMTIELWFASTATSFETTLIARDWVSAPWSGGWVIQMRASASGPVRVFMADWNTGTPLMVGTTTTHGDGNWHHLAWTKQGDVHRLFLDGVQEATATTAAAFSAVDKRISIGHDLALGTRPLDGYVDEVRITKGFARYTANFTPPAAPFPGAGDLSGAVRDAADAPVSRLVRAYREDNGKYVGAATSDATTGAYSIPAAIDGPHTLITYPAAGENLPALALRGVVPV